MSIQIQVIYSFRGDSPQFIGHVNNRGEMSEAQFLRSALRELTNSEAEHLCKISACQMNVKEKDVLSWLERSKGKYYFDPA